MRLVSAVLGFFLRKAGLFLAILLSLFLTYLLVTKLAPKLKEAEAGRDQLVVLKQERDEKRAVRAELVEAIEAGQRTDVASEASEASTSVKRNQEQVAEETARAEAARRERDDVCGTVASLAEKVLPGPNPCDDAEEALAAVENARQRAEDGLGEAQERLAVVTNPTLTNEQKLNELGVNSGQAALQRDLAAVETDLAQNSARSSRLESAQGTWSGQVVLLWAESWRWLAAIAAVAILVPGLVKLLSYFLLMPVVNRARRPIRLSESAHQAPVGVRSGRTERSLTILLAPGEVLSARAQHVRPVEGGTKSKLLYAWRSPFISFAAGLYGLKRVAGGELGTQLTLASPDDADAYLKRIDFHDHPGIVIYPRHVVGVIGNPRLEKRWRWGLQALATWQLRYILFAGSGSLIVEGKGDVQETTPVDGRTRMEQHLVMGFDSRSSVRVGRTEDFWGFMWGKAPLAVDEYTGPFPFFWQKSNAEASSNPVTRTFNALFSAVGKLLGF